MSGVAKVHADKPCLRKTESRRVTDGAPLYLLVAVALYLLAAFSFAAYRGSVSIGFVMR